MNIDKDFLQIILQFIGSNYEKYSKKDPQDNTIAIPFTELVDSIMAEDQVIENWLEHRIHKPKKHIDIEPAAKELREMLEFLDKSEKIDFSLKNKEVLDLDIHEYSKWDGYIINVSKDELKDFLANELRKENTRNKKGFREMVRGRTSPVEGLMEVIIPKEKKIKFKHMSKDSISKKEYYKGEEKNREKEKGVVTVGTNNQKPYFTLNLCRLLLGLDTVPTPQTKEGNCGYYLEDSTKKIAEDYEIGKKVSYGAILELIQEKEYDYPPEKQKDRNSFKDNINQKNEDFEEEFGFEFLFNDRADRRVGLLAEEKLYEEERVNEHYMVLRI